jgi:anti-anti-sigma factor
MEKLEISTQELPDLNAVLCTLSGAVDVFSYKELKQAFDQMGPAFKPALLIDMARVSYVGSSGWSVIFLQTLVQEKESGCLLLFGMSERVERSLNIIMPRKRHINVAPDFEGAKALLLELRNSASTAQA